MTPNEKAEELVRKYGTYAVMWTGGIDVEKQNCKMCALIAVDEILSMGILSDSGDWRMAKPYWIEVKKEIENL
jgi:hypothetical protein